jgi:hypothetical protein
MNSLNENLLSQLEGTTITGNDFQLAYVALERIFRESFERDKRGVKTQKEFAILTAEISKATFGLTPIEYKKFKGLKRENLRDHMNNLELIFSMLGERVSTEITRNKDAHGFDENKNAAKEGGKVAGNARRDAEKRIGKTIISGENFLSEPEKKKLEKKD